MSWKSPGPGDSRGSPERERPSAPIIDQSSSLSEEDRINPSTQQYRPTSIQPQLQPLQPLQQLITPRDEGESSIVQGGSHSPHQSRLIGYTTSPSTGHRLLPQSYPAGQSFIQPFSQSYSPPLQPLHLTNEIGNIGEQTHASWGSSQGSTSQSQISSLPSSQVSSPQYVPQAWDRRPSPPPMPYARAPHITSHPQIPRSQTLLPSITSLSLDTATHGRVVGQSQSPISPPTSSARSPISESLDDLKPLPQNLRGDPFRSAKVKTELCRFFKSNKGCIFGAKCNYAHGEHELKFNKLMDLEAAGLVDVEVFRCHVCSTWVATGACPFDQRCTRLHDPRVIGMQPSWLPHAEILINNTKKGLEVDKLYHCQYSSIYSCSPIYGFAPKKRWKADEISTNSAWKELYSFCCNMDADQPYSQGAQWRLSPQTTAASQDSEIKEMHRLAMVLMIREKRKARHFIYLPSHVFCGELCLVLQASYFRLEVVESFQESRRYQVFEISQEEAAKIFEVGKGDHIIIAREIAFGPVADASVRPVSIWFNIKSEDIAPCTRQQARRHKRSRHRLRTKRNYDNQPEEAKISASCSIPPFICHQPMDDVAFNLITGIQTHRYRVLNYFSSSPDERTLRSLALEEERLRKSFESQRRFWMTWTWPKKHGIIEIKDDTEVPVVDGTYNFVTYGDPGYEEDSIFFGYDRQDRNTDLQVVSKQAKLATGLVWKSFVMNIQLLLGQGAVDVPKEEDRMPTHDPILPTIRRIPTLRSLSLGYSAVRGSSRNIPIISPQVCTSAPVVISLDALIREWKMMQRQYEENSSHPLRDARQGRGNPDSAQRRPLSYPSEVATLSWSREVPQL
mmetsp:Transcript_7399/g.16781  ORF Transcript_7399/g.16781 Transcript_7399/m.16781 type:complete len:847 (-) Transcript_7399:1469-4009(-)|eukprot:CAMPEP_0172327596 /NCGR_PEP_ID=MMETSP1058-20130122/59914_1 /TAXON_ID=83371 /ORGANISM="Detonula confervacea, Strain CCMP 353" /LENGTH=846 /DNA_ID=CAMNT_0013044677 /DNA_START=255 /DNA_END=2795 /DNA_ORIENTATION=+